MRLAVLLSLAASLAWLTVEEKSRLGALLFSLPWAGLIAARLRLPIRGQAFEMLSRGALAGALAGPLAGLLMLLKISLHSHVQPDYELGDVLAVLSWTPVGAILGAVFGAGLALVRQGYRS
ncbi:MAG TPA: hypothetical protein VLD63_11840 [Anaerolineales bacterium]|nr:hypothetical protein [Anaerolineales bacterium]